MNICGFKIAINTSRTYGTEYYLPADVAALLDIESLVVSKDSFVDKEPFG